MKLLYLYKYICRSKLDSLAYYWFAAIFIVLERFENEKKNILANVFFVIAQLDEWIQQRNFCVGTRYV